MGLSFEDRMSRYLNGKISGEDYEILLKELQSGLYDAEIANDFYTMLESPCADDRSISELDKERIFHKIISSEPFEVSRMLRRRAEAARAVASRVILFPAVIRFMPAIIRLFNDVVIRRLVRRRNDYFDVALRIPKIPRI